MRGESEGRVEFRVMRGEIFDLHYLSIEGIVKELGVKGGEGLPLTSYQL